MTPHAHPYGGTARPTADRTLRRLARKVAAVLAECHYAQARMLQLRMNPDRYVIGGGQGTGHLCGIPVPHLRLAGARAARR